MQVKKNARNESDNNQVVHNDCKACEGPERGYQRYFATCVDEEGKCGGQRGDECCLARSSENPGEPVTFTLLLRSKGVAPGVEENEDIISSDAQQQENRD